MMLWMQLKEDKPDAEEIRDKTTTKARRSQSPKEVKRRYVLCRA
jgi:hypothetical protein